MSDFHKKPGTPEEVLRHYGVKGMRWGVRKEEDVVGTAVASARSIVERNNDTKAYMAAAASRAVRAEKLSPEKRAANLEAGRQEFLKKFQGEDASGNLVPPEKLPSEGKEPYFTTAEKVQLGLALGAVGGLLAYGAYANRFQLSNMDMLDRSGAMAKAGEKLGLGTFFDRITQSQAATMGVDEFFRPESFARPELNFNAGHIFKRISSMAETEFTQATYCSSNDDDFNRYAVALGVSGVKRHEVSFAATGPIKIPTLNDVLHTVREQMASEYGHSSIDQVPHDSVLERYKSISHQQWRGDEPSQLINALKAKGFGGIVDEMDSGVFSNHPLVLFSDNVGPKTAKVLMRKDLRKSLAALREIDDPPGRKYALNQKGQPKASADPFAGLLNQVLAPA